MSLELQIKTIILSVAYGVFLFYFFKLNNKILYNKLLPIKIIGSISIMILISLLFFLLLIKINNGYLHIYELFLMLLTYFLIAHINKK